MRHKRVAREVRGQAAGSSDPAFLQRVLLWSTGVGEGSIALMASLVLAVRTALNALMRLGRGGRGG